MFDIGDKVLYPMHGAGIIETIEEKEILGEKKKYYFLNMLMEDIKILIPIESVEAMGIRKIVSKQEALAAMEIFSQAPTQMDKNWTKRYRENESKMKNGDIYEIAEVVKNLTALNKAKKLSTGERKILHTAKQLLISELMLALEIDYEEIQRLL